MRNCDIQVIVRVGGQVIGSDYALGITEDDGITVTVPLGYLPNIANAAPGDITLHLLEPLEESHPAFVSREDDHAAGVSRITFGA